MLANNFWVIGGLFLVWCGYEERRGVVNTNPFLRNNKLYLIYQSRYRSLSRRLANSAGIPLGTLDNL